MPWPNFILIFIFSLTLSSCSNLCHARHHHHKLPSAVVVGTVYCDTCFQDDLSKSKHFISGATVAVECEQGSSRPAFYQEVKTDDHGTFRVALPFSVSKHEKEIQGCNVKLIKSSEPFCAVASTASSSAIHLKQRTRNKHIFSAGFFSFKPLKQPGVCNQKPSVTNQNLLVDPLVQNGQNLPLMPPLPNLPPLPSLPPLTSLPGLPGLPMPAVPKIPAIPQIPTIPQIPGVPQKEVQSSEEKKVEKGEVSPQFFFFPPVVGSPPSGILPPNPLQPAPLLPNPLQPPPAPLIPNPFQPPSPPPTVLPPVPMLPPLPPVPNVPGIIPTVPGVPTIPGLLPPGLPVPPVIPAVPIGPGLLPPGLPVPPIVPGVPGLTPTPTAPPVAPAVPTIPGIPLPPLPPLPGVPIPPLSGNAKKANP